MDTEKIQILQKANRELDKLKEEMNRPEEDVVTFSICYSVRKSIADFLSYYLAINKVDASGANTVADMLQLCSRLDDKFRDLNLSILECYNDAISSSKTHCTEVEWVTLCIEIAEKTRELVGELSRIKLNEN